MAHFAERRRPGRPSPEDLADRNLAARVRAGEGWAFAELARRHAGVIHSILSRYFLTGGDHDDLRQEALIGLLRACQDHDPAAPGPFRAFSALCIERMVITALKTDQRDKHTPLNSALRFEQPIDTAEDEYAALGDLVAGPLDTAAAVQHREDLRVLRHHLPHALGDIEATVLARVLNGATLEQAGRGLGTGSKAAKTADNALQRARHKARRLLESDAA